MRIHFNPDTKRVTGYSKICPDHTNTIEVDDSFVFDSDYREYEVQDGAVVYVGKTQEMFDEELLLQKSENKRLKNEELLSIKVTTQNGNIFDGNETARLNMLSAIQSADIVGLTEAEWKLSDNTVQVITLDELKEALALSIQEVGVIVKKYV